MINGSLVTINETISKSSDADGDKSFYHLKVISVRPENDTDVAISQQHTTDSETKASVAKSTD